MTIPNRQMHLNFFMMGTGHHEASWRHPETFPERSLDIRYYQELAQKAERAKMDSVFLADGLSNWGGSKYSRQGGLEPFTLLSALASVTERIGLIGTVSTTYDEPFHVARRFASLDHISRGRAGWNIVTSADEQAALNFGRESHLEHHLRYERAHEFLEVATRLWDSWEDDARIVDKESGIYAETDKIRAIAHKGEWFSVQGPLNVPRPPQGHPLLVQAGSSEDGKDFAAHWAEAIFTAQQTFEDAQAFYADVKARAAALNRNPDDLVILPGFAATVGETQAEAEDKEAELHALIAPERALTQFSRMFKVNLFTYPLDGPLPELPPVDEVNGHKSRYQLIKDLVEREQPTIRQLIERLAGGRGHRTFAGTPVQIADQLEDWFTGGAADGFNVMPPLLPGGLDDFVRLVVPELQRRGLFRTEYAGDTLRENYGLPRPANQFTRTAGFLKELPGQPLHREHSSV